MEGLIDTGDNGEVVLLPHGDGGALTRELIERVFWPRLANPLLSQMGDGAVLGFLTGRVVLTTDSFVVDPLFFPGGDIGKLAVCGTVNDLAVSGAVPRYLTAGFIIEEGLPLSVLERVVASMAAACRDAGVEIVAGDTKVVERGAADGLFINTAGVGVMPAGVEPGCGLLRPGDVVLINGNLGDHGLTILSIRHRLDTGGLLASDCAPLNGLTDKLIRELKTLRVMRDLTRGGLATAAKEIAGAAGKDILLRESDCPVSGVVRGACELLGLDPLYLANEGKLLAVVGPEEGGRALDIMRGDSLGRDAAVIGRVLEGPGDLLLQTELGGTKLLDLLAGDPLPRIC
ncbi:MAG: hydrogenase expression/formation protein HypE [Peptococcaceae bacterium]|jgi:hydrogenase expression/formation protein HypE|nr:hydrogenase expression/formation protein HypE [Peptococcaceae bacterium]